VAEIVMLSSQRALFDIPADVCYLNAAGWSPLPRATLEAARAAVARKSQPWTIDAKFAVGQYERARSAAAALIGADPNDVSLVSSVSYGAALAGKILKPARGSRVLVLENDHASAVLEWMTRSQGQEFSVDTVAQPANGDWTTAVLEAIEKSGAPPLSLVSISSVHWSDGGRLDLVQIRAALQKHAAALFVDGTHSVGILATDVKVLDPDFLIFPTYKWVLGPYGRAFVYVAKRHQAGVPLEQTSSGRRDVAAENAVYFKDTRYLSDARRYDMGERDHFISMEMASIGMEMVATWGSTALTQRLSALTRRIAQGLAELDIFMLHERVRAPHILSLKFHRDLNPAMLQSLASEKIYVASRLGRLRISPHVYNDEADIDVFISAMRRGVGR
jgi:selenocysteine lyase/cysteine desulfurase